MDPALNPQILDVGNGCKCYFDDERECYVVFPSADPTNLVAEVESMQEAIAAAATFTPSAVRAPI